MGGLFTDTGATRACGQLIASVRRTTGIAQIGSGIFVLVIADGWSLSTFSFGRGSARRRRTPFATAGSVAAALLGLLFQARHCHVFFIGIDIIIVMAVSSLLMRLFGTSEGIEPHR